MIMIEAAQMQLDAIQASKIFLWQRLCLCGSHGAVLSLCMNIALYKLEGVRR